MTGLDTNVLLRYLLRDDPAQAVRAEIAAALDRVLATAQFEIEDKDLALAALDDFRASAADFSDYLIGRRNRAAGARETVTFDRSLKGLEGFRLL